jgi:hypothetical protein
MGTVTLVLPLISEALAVIAAFKGDANLARSTGQIQDAIDVVESLIPLVVDWGNGVEVTPEEVIAALEGKDAALAAFDKLILERSV